MLKAAFGKACSGLAWAFNTQDGKRSFRQYRLMVGLGAPAAGAFGLEAAADASSTVPSDSAALPTDKLACHKHVASPRTPVVLLSCGSFNPPTVMHLRMFDLATSALAQRGFDVWGCYMSPVADAYGKKGLAPVQHRLQMCRLAAADTANVMVSGWEASQQGHTRTLQVLKHVSESLKSYMQQADDTGTNDTIHHQQHIAHAEGLKQAAGVERPRSAECGVPGAPDDTSRGAGRAETSSRSRGSRANQTPSTGSKNAAAPQQQIPRVMLLCGADLLATIAQPGVWKDPDIILRDYGIVCICRAGTDMRRLLGQPGSLLHQYRSNIMVVEEPVPNFVSSTKVRQLLADDQPVRYLVPDSVIAYIKQHGLYQWGLAV